MLPNQDIDELLELCEELKRDYPISGSQLAAALEELRQLREEVAKLRARSKRI